MAHIAVITLVHDYTSLLLVLALLSGDFLDVALRDDSP